MNQWKSQNPQPEQQRVIVTVVGQDRVGIIAGVSGILAAQGVNILDISQTILQDFFTMIMVVDISHCKVSLQELQLLLRRFDHANCFFTGRNNGNNSNGSSRKIGYTYHYHGNQPARLFPQRYSGSSPENIRQNNPKSRKIGRSG